MKVLTDVRHRERWLTQRMASWDSPWVRRVLPAAEEAAEHTKLWCGAALVLGTLGGRRGRKAAAAGLASMALAETISNAVVKPLCDRRRPPEEWFEDQEVGDRPDSSSFPSGHTAAAIGFTAGIAPVWPWAAAACAVPAVTVAAERVHSGAHYPSDVIAGATIGLVAAGLVRTGPRFLLRHLW
ncbi:phosphatase PAP2 family protein [Streptomyces sp. NPDC048436]|uniref:phosphatase PAP2 family protein n=1 Tax=Streptomyces sp. NPDC048436 TaxID=3365550 RepID=UPI003716C5E8